MAQGKTITALSLVACRPRKGAGSKGVEQEPHADADADAADADDAMPAGGTLIISPKSVLDATWAAEIRAKMVGSHQPLASSQSIRLTSQLFLQIVMVGLQQLSI